MHLGIAAIIVTTAVPVAIAQSEDAELREDMILSQKQLNWQMNKCAEALLDLQKKLKASGIVRNRHLARHISSIRHKHLKVIANDGAALLELLSGSKFSNLNDLRICEERAYGAARGIAAAHKKVSEISGRRARRKGSKIREINQVAKCLDRCAEIQRELGMQIRSHAQSIIRGADPGINLSPITNKSKDERKEPNVDDLREALQRLEKIVAEQERLTRQLQLIQQMQMGGPLRPPQEKKK